MTNKPYFAIVEIVSWPIGHVSKFRFKVMETNFTLDGPRTRLCDGAWETRGEAETYLKDNVKSKDD